MKIKKAFPVLMTLLVISMPFLIHYGLSALGAEVFGLILLVIFIPRILLMPTGNKLFKTVMMVLALLYCSTVAVYESGELLLYYPVLMSSFFALLFFLSLFSEKTLIEEFVRLSGKEFPEEAKAYMRGLTKAWGGLLLFNAGVAAYSACCHSAQFWLLYNGIIAYALIFVFVVLEVIYRGIYRKRYHPNH